MKRQCQEKFMARWRAHQKEYRSFEDFVNDPERQTQRARELCKRLGFDKD